MSNSILISVLIALAVIVASARVVGLLFERFGQPSVIGEIIVGILLGPSLLGWLQPTLFHSLFPASITPSLTLLAQIGLIFYMFLVGLEFDPGQLRRQLRLAVMVSNISIALPFALGVLLAALGLYRLNGSAGVAFLPFALFCGTALSITAFPVLARILEDRGWSHTKVGQLAIACASIDDLSAWCLLAIAIAVTRTGGLATALPTLAAIGALAGAMVLVIPYLGRPLLRRFEARGDLDPLLLTSIDAMVLLAAAATQAIGIDVIFGGFLMGAVLPKTPAFCQQLRERINDFVTIVLLPVFFVLSGLNTRLGLLNQPWLWGVAALILLAAVAGKFLGTYGVARWQGLPKSEARTLGWLMNTRGLTELIVLNIGLRLGVISPLIFTLFVLMALGTTLMASPLLNREAATLGEA